MSVNDAKRRAADALIEALDEGNTLRGILELAMDDNTASDRVLDLLALYHDELDGFLP